MRRLAQVGVGSVAVWLVVATAAVGFPDWSGPYTQKNGQNCGPGDGLDPVNILFKGEQAGYPNTAQAIATHAAWNNNNGSAQDARVKTNNGYDCRGMDTQRANHGNLAPARFHTRLWGIPASLDSQEKKTIAPVHHETVWWCGHAVDNPQYPGGDNGFDDGRDKLLNEMATGGHGSQYQYWGNTQLFKQCNDFYVGSTGGGFIINNGHSH